MGHFRAAVGAFFGLAVKLRRGDDRNAQFHCHCLQSAADGGHFALSLVEILAGAAADELQVVNEDGFDVPPAHGDARFGADIVDALAGGVVDVELGVGNLLVGAEKCVALVLADDAGADFLVVHLAVSDDDTVDEVGLHHFERKDEGGFSALGHLVGNVEKQGRFAHARTAGDDHELPGAQATELVVDLLKAGGQPLWLAAGRDQALHVYHRFVDDRGGGNEGIGGTVHADLEDFLAGLGDNVLHV